MYDVLVGVGQLIIPRLWQFNRLCYRNNGNSDRGRVEVTPFSGMLVRNRMNRRQDIDTGSRDVPVG